MGVEAECAVKRIDAVMPLYEALISAEMGGACVYSDADKALDMMVDLMHWCKAKGVNFNGVFEFACDEYKGESEGE